MRIKFPKDKYKTIKERNDKILKNFHVKTKKLNIEFSKADEYKTTDNFIFKPNKRLSKLI